MRLTVNGSDITSFVRQDILLEWQFSDSPGSVQYSPPVSAELAVGLKSKIHPLNQSSPLSVPMAITEIDLDSFTFTGKMRSAPLTSPSVITLNIDDDIQGRLQFQTVIGSWEGTPAFIAREILISYGIDFHANSFGQCIAEQELAGLQYEYTVNITDATTLQDSLDALSKAGWMRLCMASGMMYAIQGVPLVPKLPFIPFVISAGQLWGLPSERERSISPTSGGTVKWLASEVVIPKSSQTRPTFDIDYSTGQLILLNPSGAFFLIVANSDVGRVSYEFPVSSRFAANFIPGDWFKLDRDIVGRDYAIGQLVGVRQESQLKSIMTLEIAQWIG